MALSGTTAMTARPRGAIAAVALVCAGLSPDAADAAKKPDGAEPSKSDKWIHRHAPHANTGEIGVFGGVILPTPNLELFEPDEALPDDGYRRLRAAGPEIGVRGGYYPLRFLGLELEGAVMPMQLRDVDRRATLWTVRGQVVGQLGLWSVTPFVLAGVGGLGVGSDRGALGNDADVGFHFGGGVKVWVHDRVNLRVDLRDTLTAKQGIADGVGHTGEVLLGLSITLGRKKVAKAGPTDRDGDGFLDDEDKCRDEPGVAPDGCPRGDRDGDGFFDDVDKCVDEPGIEPDGCPRPDTDKDKIADEVDKCIDVPETRNGFEDHDGCPDEVPKEVEDFTGVLKGIQFDVDKETIQRASIPILDRAVAVLEKHPDVKMEIAGHTDSTGPREHNLELSRRRARAVKTYLVDHGIAEDRLTTRGYGPDEAIASNETAEGRAENRRIEFRIRK